MKTMQIGGKLRRLRQERRLTQTDMARELGIFNGLAVAIIVTSFYYYFIGKIEKLVTDINDELTAFADEYGLSPESEEELMTTALLPKL